MPTSPKPPDTHLGGARAEQALSGLIAYAANRALWFSHNEIARRARGARACLRCSQEAGFIASDGPEDKPREYEMHKECRERIGAALGYRFTTASVQP